jgi:hypothetical protein
MFDKIIEEEIPLRFGKIEFSSSIRADIDKKLKALEPIDGAINEFMEITVPEAVLAALKKSPVKFDRVIIDEGQDITKPIYLDVIDEILKDGLTGGNCYIFADFLQDLGNNINRDIDDIRNKITSKWSFVNYMLSTNCRNTKKIGEELINITGYDISEYKFGDVYCPDVDFRVCSKPEEQKPMLQKILTYLLKEENIKPCDITILTAAERGGNRTEFIQGDNLLIGCDIVPFDERKTNQIGYTSIRRYKGMECQVIILIDVETYTEDEKQRNMPCRCSTEGKCATVCA